MESNNCNLKPGDLVRLKSGGPCMTLGILTNDGLSATCHWFSGDMSYPRCMEPHSVVLPLVGLERV